MRYIALACALLAAGCTSNPAYNTGAGGIGGAAVGCGIGAAVTAPLLGVGCIPGAIIGGAAGATMGAASTYPPPQYYPSPQYYP